ncbi:FecR family protein [Nitrospina sp. 32_T5]|uniref:FecR family protein n=1 Tax=unclassified Nitrospina TaxID=2638683 RepID=UPI003F9774E8
MVSDKGKALPDESPQEARQWVVRLASGEMTPSEARRFKKWLHADARHRDAFRRERRLWQELEALRGAFAADMPGSPVPVSSAPAVGPANDVDPLLSSPRSKNPFAVFRWAAACFCLFVLWAQFGFLWLADHRTAEGELRRVELPDGSTAHLNTATAMNVHYENGVRHIELLEGEALFDVRRDASRPFRVTTRQGVVEVLGTRFGVSHSKESLEVTVLSGEVAVVPPSQSSLPVAENPRAVHLTAGQAVEYISGSPSQTVRNVNVHAVLPWTRGRIVIDEMPFADAIEKLDAYFPGRVLILREHAAQQPVSGLFHVDQAQSAIRALASTQGLRATHITDYLLVLR